MKGPDVPNLGGRDDFESIGMEDAVEILVQFVQLSDFLGHAHVVQNAVVQDQVVVGIERGLVPRVVVADLRLELAHHVSGLQVPDRGLFLGRSVGADDFVLVQLGKLDVIGVFELHLDVEKLAHRPQFAVRRPPLARRQQEAAGAVGLQEGDLALVTTVGGRFLHRLHVEHLDVAQIRADQEEVVLRHQRASGEGIVRLDVVLGTRPEHPHRTEPRIHEPFVQTLAVTTVRTQAGAPGGQSGQEVVGDGVFGSGVGAFVGFEQIELRASGHGVFAQRVLA